MNNTFAKLELLRLHAQRDPGLKENLLATRKAADPMHEFCKIAFQAGHDITVGELFAIGQEYSDNQCKSMNGGNAMPYEAFDDSYEEFLNSL